VADLIALLQGGGQASAQAVIADLQAVAQAAGAHNNDGLSVLLTDLQTAANPAAQGGQSAANAPANSTQAAAADPLSSGDFGSQHSPSDMAHHFHHMWG
jgi:hypothetical protein